MSKRLVAVYLSICLGLFGIFQIAQADNLLLLGAGGGTGGTYTGPGDIAGSAIMFFSTRCYSRTTNSKNVADVWDSSTGSTTETLLTCSSGGVVNETVNPLATTCGSGCVVKTLYDQIGTFCGSSQPCDVTQATNSKRPTLTTNFNSSGHSCLTFAGASSQILISTNNLGNQAQPLSFSNVVERTANFTTSQYNVDFRSGSLSFNFQTSTNTNGFFAGNTGETWTQSDSTLHATGVSVNSGTNAFYVDGATASGAAGGPVGNNGMASSGTAALGGKGNNTLFLTGNICESAVWTSVLSSSTFTSLANNQLAWW